ncbi:hypothetical protein JAAARDRAFT_390992 [Jaapia argillacea MUCL 33604]|uniref:Uncharacterized protein n=1 Tax=Jaapia argillacea MUCL 33604 TaxID=933084 RepID=A0A067QMC2_9AGAM|nr:hypothetical protein JAAARDRAFT_390992 [Jaapia argillacea MUCL 33604]
MHHHRHHHSLQFFPPSQHRPLRQDPPTPGKREKRDCPSSLAMSTVYPVALSRNANYPFIPSLVTLCTHRHLILPHTSSSHRPFVFLFYFFNFILPSTLKFIIFLSPSTAQHQHHCPLSPHPLHTIALCHILLSSCRIRTFPLICPRYRSILRLSSLTGYCRYSTKRSCEVHI